MVLAWGPGACDTGMAGALWDNPHRKPPGRFSLRAGGRRRGGQPVQRARRRHLLGGGAGDSRAGARGVPRSLQVRPAPRDGRPPLLPPVPEARDRARDTLDARRGRAGARRVGHPGAAGDARAGGYRELPADPPGPSARSTGRKRRGRCGGGPRPTSSPSASRSSPTRWPSSSASRSS